MAVYLYLSVTPEALIASILPPLEFGVYMAVGGEAKHRGHAMFLAVDSDLLGSAFPYSEIESRCLRSAYGDSEHSLYVSTYRTMEHVTHAALGSLYLATPDGRVLEVARTSSFPPSTGSLHLYQEICPLEMRVVSLLDPKDFCARVTGSSNEGVPRLLFTELRLGELANNPHSNDVGDLPYQSMERLRTKGSISLPLQNC
jgi:hypothetical protein